MLVRRRMNKSALARQLGVSHTWVTNRLSGQQEIGLNELQRIAAILDVEITDLLPRPTPGRVIATVPTTSDRLNVHSDGSPERTTRKRPARKRNPIGRPRRDAAAPASAVLPTQRRPTLVSGPGQRMAA